MTKWSFWNVHLWPQTLLLTDAHGQNSLPLNFIFLTDEIDMIATEWSTRDSGATPESALRVNPSHRARHSNMSGVRFEKQLVDASNDEVNITTAQEAWICRLYWLDYLGLGLWPPSAACHAAVHKAANTWLAFSIHNNVRA